MVITFSSYILAIHSLIALITNEAIKRFDDSAKVKAFRDGVDATLALGRTIIVIGTFEDEAEALGDESDLSRLSPTKEVKSYLTHAVILGHVVHCLTPAFEGTGEGFLRMTAAAATLRAEALETGVLGMADGIVKVKLGGKVPFAVVCVLATDIVGMKGKKCLVGRHSGRAAVKELHREVKLREI
jgi:hypothetical protein